MQKFEDDLYHDEYDYVPFELVSVLVIQRSADQVHEVAAVRKFLVHHPCAFADREVRQRQMVQRLQVFPIPIKVRRIWSEN